MATIVSSVFKKNNLQPDGTRQVIEDHEDSTGKFHRRSRYAPVGADVAADMAAYAATLPADLAIQEEETNLQGLFDGRLLPADLTFDWTDSGDEVKLVCTAFMQMDPQESISLRPAVSGYTNRQIADAGFTAAERDRIQARAAGVMSIESQINQRRGDKEVFFGARLI
jgi:hypothetical protein